MSRLVRLYPRAWRDRYEEEFLILLDERPLTTRDVVDTLRGALDAHLHPHLAGGDIKPSPWTHRIPGLLALAGGATYLASIVGMALAGPSESVWSNVVGWSVILMVLSLPGDYMAAHGRRIAIAIGLLGAIVVAANVAGWSVPGLALALAGFVIVFGGMLAMAAIRAEIQSAVRWLLLVSVVLVPIAVPVAITLVREAAALGPLDAGPLAALAILLPYGLTWVSIGLRMTIRGAPTIIDPPAVAIEAVVSEVRPA
jgi:hypothetical protein